VFIKNLSVKFVKNLNSYIKLAKPVNLDNKYDNNNNNNNVLSDSQQYNSQVYNKVCQTYGVLIWS